MSREVYLVAEFERTGCDECGYPIRYTGIYMTLEKALGDNKNQQITVYNGELDRNLSKYEIIVEYRLIKTITKPIQLELYINSEQPELGYGGRTFVYLILGQENEELNGCFRATYSPWMYAT